jgi:hypothetical protein
MHQIDDSWQVSTLASAIWTILKAHRVMMTNRNRCVIDPEFSLTERQLLPLLSSHISTPRAISTLPYHLSTSANCTSNHPLFHLNPENGAMRRNLDG